MPLEAVGTVVVLFAWTVCMARCGLRGLRAAFLWLRKPEIIEDHVCTTPRLQVGAQDNVPCVVGEGVPWTDGGKSSNLPPKTQTSCRLQTGMDDCVAAVTAAVAAYRRCKQIIKNINQLALVLGVAPRGRCSRVPRTHVAFATCVVQQLRLRYIL